MELQRQLVAYGSLDSFEKSRRNPTALEKNSLCSKANSYSAIHGHLGENFINHFVSFGWIYPKAKIEASMCAQFILKDHMSFYGSANPRIVPRGIPSNHLSLDLSPYPDAMTKRIYVAFSNLREKLAHFVRFTLADWNFDESGKAEG